LIEIAHDESTVS